MVREIRTENNHILHFDETEFHFVAQLQFALLSYTYST